MDELASYNLEEVAALHQHHREAKPENLEGSKMKLHIKIAGIPERKNGQNLLDEKLHIH